MRALVTGASGFLGHHLAAHLRDLGDDVIPSGADVTDPEALARELDRHRPEVVYHLAAQSDVGRGWTDPVRTLRVNAEGTLNVLGASRRAGAALVVAASSAEVYGPADESELPLGEDAPLRPANPYAASKAAAEMMCLQARFGAGPDVVRVRAFNLIGPGQPAGFAASSLAAQIAANERSGGDRVLVGNLDARRDFTDVRDAARACRLLAGHGAVGEAYNLCSGADRSIRDLAEMLMAVAGRPMELVADPDRLRPSDVAVRRGDPGKLRAATGWRAEIPLAQTLADLLEHWRAAERVGAPAAGR